MDIKDHYERTEKIIYKSDAKLRRKCFVKLNYLPPKLFEKKYMPYAALSDVKHRRKQFLSTVSTVRSAEATDSLVVKETKKKGWPKGQKRKNRYASLEASRKITGRMQMSLQSSNKEEIVCPYSEVDSKLCKSCERPIELGSPAFCVHCKESLFNPAITAEYMPLIESDDIVQSNELTQRIKVCNDFETVKVDEKVIAQKSTIEANARKMRCYVVIDNNPSILDAAESKHMNFLASAKTSILESKNFVHRSMEPRKVPNDPVGIQTDEKLNNSIKNNCENVIYLPTSQNLRRNVNDSKCRSQIHCKKLQIHKCSKCEFSTKSKQEYYSHMNTHRMLFKCSYCSYQALLKNNLRLHILKHVSYKPFKCKLCDYSTGDNSHLSRHMRIHSGRPIFCVACDYRCIQLVSLKNHVERHEGILMKCPFCQYVTMKPLDLMNHYSQSERGKWYNLMHKCPDCDFWCYEKVDFINHVEENNCSPRIKTAKNKTSRVKKRTPKVIKETIDIPSNELVKQEAFENSLSNQNKEEHLHDDFLNPSEIKKDSTNMHYVIKAEVCEDGMEEVLSPAIMGDDNSSFSWSENEDLSDLALSSNVTDDGNASSFRTENQNVLPNDNKSQSSAMSKIIEAMETNLLCKSTTNEFILQNDYDGADIKQFEEFEKIILNEFENNKVWRTIYTTRIINEFGFEYYLCLCKFEDILEARIKILKIFLEQLSFLFLEYCKLTDETQVKFDSFVIDHIKDIKNAFLDQLPPNIPYVENFNEISNYKYLYISYASILCFNNLIEKSCCDQHGRAVRKGKDFSIYLTKKFCIRELQLNDKNRFLKGKLCLVKNYVTSSRYSMTLCSYKSLLFNTLCRLVIFNQCDPTALSQITVKQWETAKQLSALSPSLIDILLCLDDHQLEMYNFFNVAMNIGEKIILIPQPCVIVMDLLSDSSVRQSVNISPSNPYLFPSDAENSICGDKCLYQFFENYFAKEFHRNFITYNERLDVGVLDIPKKSLELINVNIPKRLQHPLVDCLPPKLNFIILSCHSSSILLSRDTETSLYPGEEMSTSIQSLDGKPVIQSYSFITDCAYLSYSVNDDNLMEEVDAFDVKESKEKKKSYIKKYEKFERAILNEFENSEVKDTIFVTRKIFELGFEFHLCLKKYGKILKRKKNRVKNFMMQLANLFVNFSKSHYSQISDHNKFNIFAFNHFEDIKKAFLSQVTSEIIYSTNDCRYKRICFTNLKNTMVQYLNYLVETTDINKQHGPFRKEEQFHKLLSLKFQTRKLPIEDIDSIILGAKSCLAKNYATIQCLPTFKKLLSEEEFEIIAFQTFYRLIIFNKCDPEALSKITLEQWDTAKMKSCVSSLVLNSLTFEEQKIHKFFNITISVGGKLILIPAPCVTAMNIFCDPEVRGQMNIVPQNKFLFPSKPNHPICGQSCISNFLKDNFLIVYHSSFLTCSKRWEFGLLDIPEHICKLIMGIVSHKNGSTEILDCLPSNLKFAILSWHSTTNLLSEIIDRNSDMHKGINCDAYFNCQNKSTDNECFSDTLPVVNAKNKCITISHSLDSVTIPSIQVGSIQNVSNMKHNQLYQKFLSFEKETVPYGDEELVHVVHCTRRIREIGFVYYSSENTLHGTASNFMRKLASLYLKFCKLFNGADVKFEAMFNIKYITETKKSVWRTADPSIAVSLSEYISILRSTGFYLASLFDPYDCFLKVKLNVTLFNEKFDDYFEQIELSNQNIHLVHNPSSFFYGHLTINEVKALLEDNYNCPNEEKNIDKNEFRNYEEITFCRIILFNDCDPVSLSRLTIRQWQIATYKSKVSLQQLATLSRAELNMYHYFNTSLYLQNEVTGNSKLVLIPEPCVKIMNILADSKIRHSAKISSNNLYLFPSLDNLVLNEGPIDGQQYMNKFCLDNFGVGFENCKLNDNDIIQVGLFNIPPQNCDFIVKTVANLVGRFLPKSIEKILVDNNKKDTEHFENFITGEEVSSGQKDYNLQFNIRNSSVALKSSTISKNEIDRKETTVSKEFLEYELNILNKMNNSIIDKLNHNSKRIQDIGFQYYLCNNDIGDKNFENCTMSFLEQLSILFMKFKNCGNNFIFEDMFNINYLVYLKEAVLLTSSFLGKKNGILKNQKPFFLRRVLKFSGLQLAILLSKEEPNHYITFKVHEFNECFQLNFFIPAKTLPTIVGCYSYSDQNMVIEDEHDESEKLDDDTIGNYTGEADCPINLITDQAKINLPIQAQTLSISVKDVVTLDGDTIANYAGETDCPIDTVNDQTKINLPSHTQTSSVYVEDVALDDDSIANCFGKADCLIDQINDQSKINLPNQAHTSSISVKGDVALDGDTIANYTDEANYQIDTVNEQTKINLPSHTQPSSVYVEDVALDDDTIANCFGKADCPIDAVNDKTEINLPNQAQTSSVSVKDVAINVNGNSQEVWTAHEKNLVTTTFCRYLMGLEKSYPSELRIKRFLVKNPDLLSKLKAPQRKFEIKILLSNTRELLMQIVQRQLQMKPKT